MSLLPYLFDNTWSQRRDIENLRSKITSTTAQLGTARLTETQLREEVQKLQAGIGQLKLVTEALIRTLVKHGLTKPHDLADLMHEIDLEDGREDGQFDESRIGVPEWCPKCEARIAQDKTYCVFCGERFDGSEPHPMENEGRVNVNRPQFEVTPDIWCRQCQARIPEGDTHCGFCGEPA